MASFPSIYNLESLGYPLDGSAFFLIGLGSSVDLSTFLSLFYHSCPGSFLAFYKQSDPTQYFLFRFTSAGALSSTYYRYVLQLVIANGSLSNSDLCNINFIPVELAAGAQITGIAGGAVLVLDGSQKLSGVSPVADGTVTPVNSITTVNGIITAIS